MISYCTKSDIFIQKFNGKSSVRENWCILHVCCAHFAWETWKVLVVDAGHVIFVMISVQCVKFYWFYWFTDYLFPWQFGITFQGLMPFVLFLFFSYPAKGFDDHVCNWVKIPPSQNGLQGAVNDLFFKLLIQGVRCSNHVSFRRCYDF